MSGDHGPKGGPDDGRGDGWKYLDALVWAAVVVVVAIATEWFVGYLVRERLSRTLRRDLVAAAEPPQE